MFKAFIILLAGIQLSACGQASRSELNTVVGTHKASFFCLTTQSQCQISTELGDFEVKFSQVQSKALQGKKVDKAFKETLQQIQTELPFSVNISLINPSNIKTKISTVSGYLEGKDMFMGKVPVFFETEEQGNKFTAISLLASCSADIMVWRLWLIVTLADQQKSEQRLFIDFESVRL